MRKLGWLSVLVVCTSCGGSSSETPPPLEPDPQRLLPPVEEPVREEPPAVTPPAGSPAPPALSEPGAEDGAEFGIESAPPRPPAAGAAPPNHQTWGGAPAPGTPAGARPKRAPKAP
ncbi:MAG: hypothetical protein ABI895_04220 [Deltaproteobacteria bacterium]